jgi:hypothetical protein
VRAAGRPASLAGLRGSLVVSLVRSLMVTGRQGGRNDWP